MSIRDAGQPVIVATLLLHGLLAVDGSSIAPPSVDVGARVARVVKTRIAVDAFNGEKTVISLLRRRDGNRKTFLAKGLDGLAMRSPRERNVSKKWTIVSLTCELGSNVTLPDWS